MHFFVGHLVEPGQNQQNKHHRQGKSKTNHQERFTEELPDELSTQRTDRFANADLLGAFFAARRTQVHKVDTGQKQNKNPHDGKQPYVLHKSTRLYALFPVGIQVPVFHGVQENFCFEFFLVLVDLIVFDIFDFGAELGHISLIVNLGEQLEGVVAPLIFITRFPDPVLGSHVQSPGCNEM